VANDPIGAIERLAEAERSALLSGRFAALPALLVEKQALAQALSGAARTSPDALIPVLERFRANQRLIESALAGIRAAHQRLAAVRAIAEGTTAYTAEGHTRRIGATRASVEKRA
jgi:hypothetical protein